ncbi:hypothetical protein L596_021716 [Steinernema carpocapsae]|uniref:Uncharacterized protein n=1 Tax=Steinernema carpocapsae TaxID=34508 RepID=A0A4U5MJK4_STECR|nr:hypothetical protein L596_021716 [Steinernema carpocapsae]
MFRYFNDFMNCMHNIYVYECGWKVSKFICETTKVAVRAKTEKCDKSLVKCADSPIAFVDLGSSTRVSSPKTTSTKVTLASNAPKSSLKLTSSVARTKSLKLQLTTV